MDNENRLKTRAKIETGIATLAAGLFVLTLITREWIEILTGWDPDNGNGSLEWALVIGLAAVAVVVGLCARSDWQQLQGQSA